jgi:cytochrome c-type biogenesis protein CcmH/NrfG
MYSRIAVYASALLLGSALSLGAYAQQESQAEKRQEQMADQTAKQNAGHEPHMSAALEHLRQAEEE